MTAGRLAALNPSSGTDTVLYRADINSTTSSVLNISNRNAGAGTYNVALRDYDQVMLLDGNNDGSTHQFQKGNPISSYLLEVSPGFTFSALIPGTNITSSYGSTGTLLDVFKPTDRIDFYTKVQELHVAVLDPVNPVSGSVVNGNTVTGSVSGFVGTWHGQQSNTAAYISASTVNNSATSVQISRTTGLADGMKLTIGEASDGTAEVVTIDASGINTTTNTLTVTRGALGTTADTIEVGEKVIAYSDSATVTTINEGAQYAAADLTLTVTDSTGFVTGSFIQIDNEILEIESVVGNDLTVLRGRYGTTDANHADGANVTLLTDNGQYLINYFTEGELANSSNGGSFTFGFGTSESIISLPRYIFSPTSAVANDFGVVGFSFDVDRTIRLIQEDSSNTGQRIVFSETEDGTFNASPGTEYTVGVTKIGTPGSAGAYTEIDITSATPATLYTYSESATGYGQEVSIVLDPEYTQIYIYNVGGEVWANADTFTVGETTQTVQSVTTGAYGYVHRWEADTQRLYISLDTGSGDFSGGDQFYDTKTLVGASRSLATIGDGKILTVGSIGAADANRAEGSYTVTGSSSGSGTGQSFTIDVDGSGAATVTVVDGGVDHVGSDVITVLDSDLGAGGAADLTFNVATVNSLGTDGVTMNNWVEDQDYLFYTNAISANSTEKNTGIVVGPGQNLVVNASNADMTFLVNGFESDASDYEIIDGVKS